MKWTTWFPHILNSIATLIVGYLVFASNITTNMDDTLAVAYQRITDLEHQVDALRAELTRSHSANLELIERTRTAVDQLVVLESFLDRLPHPAWIKRVEVEQDGTLIFRMLVINRAYEDTFGVSRFRYRGQTDDAIWSDEVAAQFREHDLDVLNQKASKRYEESFPIRGVKVTREVIKFLIQLPAGRFGVGGVIFHYRNPFDDTGGTHNEAPPDAIAAMRVHVGRKFEDIEIVEKNLDNRQDNRN